MILFLIVIISTAILHLSVNRLCVDLCFALKQQKEQGPWLRGCLASYSQKGIHQAERALAQGLGLWEAQRGQGHVQGHSASEVGVELLSRNPTSCSEPVLSALLS